MLIKEAKKTSKDLKKGSDEWIVKRADEIFIEGDFHEDCYDMASILAGEIAKMWMIEDHKDFINRVNELLYED